MLRTMIVLQQGGRRNKFWRRFVLGVEKCCCSYMNCSDRTSQVSAVIILGFWPNKLWPCCQQPWHSSQPNAGRTADKSLSQKSPATPSNHEIGSLHTGGEIHLRNHRHAQFHSCSCSWWSWHMCKLMTREMSRRPRRRLVPYPLARAPARLTAPGRSSPRIPQRSPQLRPRSRRGSWARSAPLRPQPPLASRPCSDGPRRFFLGTAPLPPARRGP